MFCSPTTSFIRLWQRDLMKTLEKMSRPNLQYFKVQWTLNNGTRLSSGKIRAYRFLKSNFSKTCRILILSKSNLTTVGPKNLIVAIQRFWQQIEIPSMAIIRTPIFWRKSLVLPSAWATHTSKWNCFERNKANSSRPNSSFQKSINFKR